jgi:HTH-type transcriptional regulator / antitoxin HigA
MTVQPIKTEAEYDAALAEIDRLWGASEGSEAGDRLDVLLVLVVSYEAQHHPIF